jgi:PAS domain-containing protein
VKWSKRRADGGNGSEASGLAGNVLFDLVEQPLFVFAPVFDESGSLVDLTFVEMNGAARADLGIESVPFGDSVRAWLTDLDLLWTAAAQAWRSGRAEPYDLEVRRGRQSDRLRLFTIETARDGDVIVQVAAPRTDARLLRDERDRFAATLDALEDGVVVLRPIADGDEVLDARIEFVNAACTRFFRSDGFPAGLFGLGGVGVGEIVVNKDVAEAIVGAAASAARGSRTSMVLDNTGGAFPLLAQPWVRLAFARQSTEQVIMIVQDVSLPTFAEHQSTLLNDFSRAVVDAVGRPALVVRVTPSDLVIDEAAQVIRAGLDGPLPCPFAMVCGDPVVYSSVERVVRRVVERATVERDLDLGCPGQLAGARWTLAPLPGNRVFAIADRSRNVD